MGAEAVRQDPREGRGEDINFQFIVSKDEEGCRLDQFLSDHVRDVSRSRIQTLFKEECVRVNGELCRKKNRKAVYGELIEVYIPKPKELRAEPEDIPLDIVYEDDDLLVVNKPRGMVVHPAPGNESGTLVNAILFHCRGRLSSINGVIRPGIVHRIDKDTSGLLMVAKNDEAHLSLSRQLEEHSITRKYLAIVENNFRQDEGTVDKPIGRDPANRLKRCVNGIHAKRAVTHYRVLERYGRETCIACRLETGRTHQIRVHMAYLHHPLLGDPLYGSRKQKYDLKGQMLHAGVLGFCHPATGEYLEFRSDPPEDFQHMLEILRKAHPDYEMR